MGLKSGLSNLVRKMFSDVDVGSTIELIAPNGVTTNHCCYWQVTRQMTLGKVPHFELTNVDTGAIKTLSFDGLARFHRFRVVGARRAAPWQPHIASRSEGAGDSRS
jgi:hypothetical protein